MCILPALPTEASPPTPDAALIGPKKVTLLDAAPFPRPTQLDVLYYSSVVFSSVVRFHLIGSVCHPFFLPYIADNHTLG